MPHDLSVNLRRWLLALLLLGLAGTTTELLLLRHYDGYKMLVPFSVIAGAAVATVLRLARPSPATVRILRFAMLLLLGAGVLGIVLHYAGGREFQAEVDPSLSSWQLFWKVARMQAPPALAPGVLVQLGLLGLLSTYGDPLARRESALVRS